MLKLEKKNAIVKHIQDGLANASQNKKDRNISFNNNGWNDNLNYIFDSVMQLNGMFDLTCFKFNRSGFYMASIFDKESKTLISICSDKRITTLLSRSHIDTIHYTDAFCQLSKDIDPCQQMNLFGESEDKITSINSLLCSALTFSICSSTYFLLIFL